jgi:hypothetical protein
MWYSEYFGLQMEAGDLAETSVITYQTCGVISQSVVSLKEDPPPNYLRCITRIRVNRKTTVPDRETKGVPPYTQTQITWKRHIKQCATFEGSFVNLCGIWGSIGGDCEELSALGYNTLQSCESQLTFRRNVSPSILKIEESAKQETSRSRSQTFLTSLGFAYTFTLKMEAMFSLEISIFLRTTSHPWFMCIILLEIKLELF